MFERCLICTDLTDGLHRLVEFVPSLAAAGVKHVTFFHSAPWFEDGGVPRVDEEAVSRARAQLTRAPENAVTADEIKVEVEIASGRPQDTIPRAVRETQADAVLIGTPIRSLLEEKMFGSTCMSLAKEAIAPLTILRPQLVSTYTREELNLRCRHLWRYLLVPYDGGASSRHLVEQVKYYARARSDNFFKQCLLCWVVDDAGRRDIPLEPQIEEARATLDGVRQDLEITGMAVTCEVRQGDWLQEILAMALIHDITAIAAVEEERNALLSWTAPTAGKALLRSSWHPVIFFPNPKRK
ncbi:MAG: universal stress protein [Cyanobacteria bacterium J06641_5]